MEKLKAAVQGLPVEDWDAFYQWVVGEEYTRRQRLQVVEAAQAKVVMELQDAGKIPLPDALTSQDDLPEDVQDIPEWANPGTDHSAMYRLGDIVRHNGRIVRSTHNGLNHWEPGTLNLDGRIWEDITPPAPEPEPEPDTDGGHGDTAAPDWKQPIGAHDAYKLGDRVTYNGAEYESLLAANVYSPDAYPQGWRKL